ncbi:hypothetical protein RsoM2USA_247 [Ralstonia phage RsoM2USA]|nr:hypothetical protein RsoM2USA_247 [Ralstonia phage RsoM2USA]
MKVSLMCHVGTKSIEEHARANSYCIVKNSPGSSIKERIEKFNDENCVFMDFSNNIAALSVADVYVGTKDVAAALTEEYNAYVILLGVEAAEGYLKLEISRFFNFLIYCYTKNVWVEWHECKHAIDPFVVDKLKFFIDKNAGYLKPIIDAYGLKVS